MTNSFQNMLDESNHKPNKIWVGKGNEFYYRSIKSFLQNNDKNLIQHIMKVNLLLLRNPLKP